MPDEPVVIEEVWEEVRCETCHGHTAIYEGMVCTRCGGFGFTMKLMSQSTLVNGELTEVLPDGD